MSLCRVALLGQEERLLQGGLQAGRNGVDRQQPLCAHDALPLSRSGSRFSTGWCWWITWLGYRQFALLGAVLDLQVPYAPQIDPVSPAVVSESDKSIVAAWAADDGAKPPHLVNHRRSDLIGPSAALAGVMRGGYLKGEDLPEGASRGVAIQPVFVHRSLSSCRSEAFGLYARGAVPELHERRRRCLHQRCRAAHEGQRTLLWRRGDLFEHLPVYAAAVARPAYRLGACEGVEYLQRSVLRCEALELLGVDRLFARA